MKSKGGRVNKNSDIQPYSGNDNILSKLIVIEYAISMICAIFLLLSIYKIVFYSFFYDYTTACYWGISCLALLAIYVFVLYPFFIKLKSKSEI